MLAVAAQLILFPLGDFRLANGQTLQQAQIGYHTWGELNAARDNAILIPSWFNGKSADLGDYVGAGPEYLFDTTGFFVISVDALSNGVSTSPSNSPTQRGDKYPRISMADMVESQKRLVDSLGIKRLHAVAGVSMGAMQAMQWSVQYPDFMKKTISIVGTHKMGAKDILLWTSFIKMIPIGNNRNRGRGSAQSQFNEMMNNHQAGRAHSLIPKSPNDVRRQFEAVMQHDITRAFRSEDATIAAIQSEMLLVVATQDKVVSPEPPTEFARRAKAQLFTLAGDCGHNAYKCEKATLAPVINKFLRAPR